MKQISRARFDALAGYARSPGATLFGEELAWFESDVGDLLSALVLDTDDEYFGALFARDLAQRFRWISQTEYFSTQAEAMAAISTAMSDTQFDLARLRVQGDECNPTDFFALKVREDKLHERFRMLAFDDGFSGARALVSNMMRWYNDQDGNFIEQFQSTGFDARIWELYIFALLVEAGYQVGRPDPAPDFLAVGLRGRFLVEATTINPPMTGNASALPRKPTSENEVLDYVENYLPTRYAGPLTSKLNKRYWEHPEASGLPLVIAIQDFHDEMSMTYSGIALQSYLYGHAVENNSDGGITIPATVRSITEHRWEQKVVPSGFFDFPAAENISAVFFNGAGTLSKFNRIGAGVGFGSPNVKIWHVGVRLDATTSPNFVPFETEVGEGYEERWIDGLNVFHNPKALHPLDRNLLPGAAHHYWNGDKFMAYLPGGHLDSSRTVVVKVVDREGR